MLHRRQNLQKEHNPLPKGRKRCCNATPCGCLAPPPPSLSSVIWHIPPNNSSATLLSCRQSQLHFLLCHQKIRTVRPTVNKITRDKARVLIFKKTISKDHHNGWWQKALGKAVIDFVGLLTRMRTETACRRHASVTTVTFSRLTDRGARY